MPQLNKDKDSQIQLNRNIQWKERQKDFAKWHGKLIAINIPISNTYTTASSIINKSTVQPAQKQNFQAFKKKEKVQKTTTYILKTLFFQGLIIIAIILWYTQLWLCPFPHIQSTKDGYYKEESKSGIEYKDSTTPTTSVAIFPQLNADGMRCRMATLNNLLQNSHLNNYTNYFNYYLPTPKDVEAIITHFTKFSNLEVAANQNLSDLRIRWNELDIQYMYAKHMANGIHPLVTFSHPYYKVLGTLTAQNYGFSKFSLLISPLTWFKYNIKLWLVLYIEPILSYFCIASCRNAGQQHYNIVQKNIQTTGVQALFTANELAKEAALILLALNEDIKHVCLPANIVVNKQASTHYWLQHTSTGLFTNNFNNKVNKKKNSAGFFLKQQYNISILENTFITVYNDATAIMRNVCIELENYIFENCKVAFKTTTELENQAEKLNYFQNKLLANAMWEWCIVNSDKGITKLITEVGYDLLNKYS